MRSLFAFVSCYVIAARAGYAEASLLTDSRRLKLQNALKGGNLAICFLGFIPKGHSSKLRKCAQIGALAATFDLLSDHLSYPERTHEQFEAYYRSILSSETILYVEKLLHAKKTGTLRSQGLQRGVYAVEIIFSHLEIREYWSAKLDVEEFGLRSQIADDVLDYSNDVKSDHLNFLKLPGSIDVLENFLAWNFRADVEGSAFPYVLNFVLRKSQRDGRRILKSLRQSKPTQTSSKITSHISEI